MKVLYFHQHFSTPQGSTGTRSYEMAQKLISRGHQVTMVCGSYGGGKTGLNGQFDGNRRHGVVDGIDVIEFDLGYSNKDGFIKRVVTFLKFAIASVIVALRQDYDLIFATSTPLTAGIPGIIAKLFRRKPFVFEVRDLWPELPREMGVIKNPVILSMMSFLEWSTYRCADACIGLSPGIVEGIKRRSQEGKNVKMIPNGCDLRIFDRSEEAPASSEGETWRPEGVEDGDLMVVFTGTHGIANGLDNILDGAKELVARNRDDIKFVFIGDGKLKPDLRERALSEGIRNCIFLDPVPKVKLSGLLREADVGLMALANVPAFYYGTSPNKFFDYIASGLPVLNNYPGWLADMINEYECGIAVPPENSSLFADGLEKVADDRHSLIEMGERGRALARERFDRDHLADTFVDYLASVPAH